MVDKYKIEANTICTVEDKVDEGKMIQTWNWFSISKLIFVDIGFYINIGKFLVETLLYHQKWNFVLLILGLIIMLLVMKCCPFWRWDCKCKYQSIQHFTLTSNIVSSLNRQENFLLGDFISFYFLLLDIAKSDVFLSVEP